ncbi:uncharacterized protein (DUF2336 family) [Nitrospirillum amazonense]|uniref:Uncharacterized protein (DUF2336 family) n=1 Tax=Nitrospirillum amazonense TaxID=28077 RepID=A0A560FMH3_9PROT|nr:DUF2336 domain-containing protein [Nitrospirillum amazonense]TWB22818.1 uncharacterized protein (DUF2336 family) [Nitrospirillum amazonense]
MGGLDYDTAKKLATGDAADRRFVASRAETQPEILYLLATDKSAEVRREIALNSSTPRQADMMLSTDVDEGVRSGLASKIAALVPSLSADRVGQIERMTLQILETLARDRAAAVRGVMVAALKDLPNAPPTVIQQLARDLDASISGPVLRHSPILTDDDLLEIIAGAPEDERLCAIAERADVSVAVSDAIVQTEREAAVASLLGNASAQIREETLDRILDLAPKHEPWHAPLVRRPHLPPAAAARIAGFVTDSLVKVLEGRSDLPAETRQAITQAVRQRLPAAKTGTGTGNGLVDEEEAPKERPADRARRLHKEKKLTEDTVTMALGQGDRGFVMASLALLSGLPQPIVEKIIAGQSPRGVTALCWKAKLTMRAARQVQMRLAQIPPSNVLNAREGTKYPMTDDEMKWQLEFFGVE